MAPIDIKLKVLDTCVSSALIYACETWGTANVPSLEVSYRLGLKRALSVRESTNTEIVYIEADRYPLLVRMSRQQLNFWITLTTYLGENPEHPLGGLIEYGRNINLKYIRYYDNLLQEFENPQDCEKVLSERLYNEWRIKIRQKAGNDENSRSGVYLLVNPQLSPPKQRQNIFEIERIAVSRYRSGSHNLRIETGRLSKPLVPREERICCCSTGIQSLNHVLFECPLLAELHEEYGFTSVEQAFNDDGIAKFIMKMERTLGINAG